MRCSLEKCTGAWGGVTVVRKCDSHQGGVKGVSVDGGVCWSWGRCKQVQDMTAFSIHFFIVHHIKIKIHLHYCNIILVYNNNTKINYSQEDCVVFP